jgi:hypothetical protein
MVIGHWSLGFCWSLGLGHCYLYLSLVIPRELLNLRGRPLKPLSSFL